MTASVAIASAGSAHTVGSLLLGFGPAFRKELAEWWRGRRARVLLVTTSAFMVLTTLSARLAVLSAAAAKTRLPATVSLDPTVNVVAKWDQWLFLFAMGASLSLVIGERDRGTLAWSLSKPLSRTALLAAKWSAAVAMIFVFGIVVPMALCTLAAAVAYGMPDLGAIAVTAVLLVAVPAFFVALTLALGVVVPSQAGVAAVAFVVAGLPGIIGTVAPGVAAALPPSIGPWAVGFALGAPAGWITPVAWAVGLAAVAVGGVAALRRVDL